MPPPGSLLLAACDWMMTHDWRISVRLKKVVLIIGGISAFLICALAGLLYLVYALGSSVIAEIKPNGAAINAAISTNYYHGKKGGVYYVLAGNWLEIGAVKMDADEATFIVLSENYGKDAHHVYLESTRIDQPPVDVASFQAINREYARDAKTVYALLQRYGNFYVPRLQVLEHSDPASFVVLGEYAKDKNNVYYYRYDGTRVVDADPVSFKAVNMFGVDDKAAYYRGKKIDGSDGATFEVVIPAKPKDIFEHGVYAQDKAYVYYAEQDVRTMPRTPSFQVIDDRFAKDGQSVYCRGQIVPGADPRTFVLVPSLWVIKKYGKDDKHVFLDAKLIEGADPATFQTYDHAGWWARDAAHVYQEGTLYPIADAATFSVGEDSYHNTKIFDKSNVYREIAGKIEIVKK